MGICTPGPLQPGRAAMKAAFSAFPALVPSQPSLVTCTEARKPRSSCRCMTGGNAMPKSALRHNRVGLVESLDRELDIHRLAVG